MMPVADQLGDDIFAPEHGADHPGLAVGEGRHAIEQVRGLSSEIRERLEEVRPRTLGQAGRIPGLTPVAISLLLVHLKKTGRV